MKFIRTLFLGIICATSLAGCTVYSSDRSHITRGYAYDPYAYTPQYVRPAPIYYDEPSYLYSSPNYYRPRYSAPQPIYATPQGVARPERFACGADVNTGAYNCVPRRKAHFVRPIGYTNGGYSNSGYNSRW